MKSSISGVMLFKPLSMLTGTQPGIGAATVPQVGVPSAAMNDGPRPAWIALIWNKPLVVLFAELRP